MPSSDLPPEGRATVQPFDPLVLDRTVIAIPLLMAMQEELEAIEKIQRKFPGLTAKFNTAIKLNKRFRPDLKAAWSKTVELARIAGERSVEASSNRLKSVAPAASEREQQRHAILERAVAEQTLEPPFKDTPYCFGTLHAGVLRRLTTLNNALGESPRTKPIERIFPTRFEIIIDLNLEYPGGRLAARESVRANIGRAMEQTGVEDGGQGVHEEKSRLSNQYLFARLEARAIRKLVELDAAEANLNAETRRAATANLGQKARIDASKCRAIYHIWPDFDVSACIDKSIATVKADAAQNSFSARGAGITWAVMDSGIDATHRHFAKHANIHQNAEWHQDFTPDGSGALVDENGHGTHVAGIIAGEWKADSGTPETEWPLAVSRYRKQYTEDIEFQERRLESICGMAPRCKLVSLKVLDENGKGAVSNLIAAIAHVQEINGYGRRLLIQGVNLSLGYNFEPEWFACGQSPLCAEVDRLVKTGVVVVVAAGNTGFGSLKSAIGSTAAGLALTINDPGNAELAITVGSTHRDMPHVYGVSYFSSKGPTGDGRLKPDIVAPGEKIMSCATGQLMKNGAPAGLCDYVETSGTSMAAPHVSGVIAGFLSVRTEFIGDAERVKKIFLSTATDLRRDRYFQGAGLVDLMRAIQSV